MRLVDTRYNSPRKPQPCLSNRPMDNMFISSASREGKFRLWRMRPDGSGESMVNAMPPLSSDGYEWWPFKSGIYFYAYKDGNAEIDLLDLPTSRVRRISTLDKPPAPWLGGLSVSPDGKWFLYSRLDETASDLMLVENFH